MTRLTRKDGGYRARSFVLRVEHDTEITIGEKTRRALAKRLTREKASIAAKSISRAREKGRGKIRAGIRAV